MRDLVRVVNSLIDVELSKRKLLLDSPEALEARRLIKGVLRGLLSELPDNAPGIDPHKAVPRAAAFVLNA